MAITIHQTFLPRANPEASLVFYRDTLGFEVRNDVGRNGLRWITVGPAGQPDTSIVFTPPAGDPGVTDDERRTITSMMAKGTFARVILAVSNVDDVFATVQARGADVVQEPTDQPWGVRDCALRDPSGNLVRINQVR